MSNYQQNRELLDRSLGYSEGYRWGVWSYRMPKTINANEAYREGFVAGFRARREGRRNGPFIRPE